MNPLSHLGRHLGHTILVPYQGGPNIQHAGLLKHAEDLQRELNANIGSKISYETISILWPGRIFRKTVLALMLLLWAGLPPVQADPPPCAEISKSYDDKLVVSDITGVPAPTSGFDRRDVKSALNMKLEALEKDLEDVVKFVFCTNRTPSGESDYQSKLSETLNDYNVVMEVWGEANENEAVISYLVVPLRHYEHFIGSNDELTGFLEVFYLRGSANTDLAALFRDAPEAQALASVALGLKYLKRASAAIDPNQITYNFNYAREFFCRAVGILDQIRPSEGRSGLEPEDWQRLFAYAKASAYKCAQLALDDPRYFGTLRDLDQKRLKDCGCCPGGE